KIKQDGRYERFQAKWFGAEAAAAAPPPNTGSALTFKPALVAKVWPIFLQGLQLTVTLAAAGLVFGLPLGLLLALARLSPFKPVAAFAVVYVELFRGTPLLVQIFFLYFVLPAFGVSMPELLTAILALSLNAAAYIAEIFRSAIQSVPRGQMEAARSLGMTYPQAMREVVLPQATVRAIPPLTNEGVALLKDSSLVSIMGMTELTRTGQELSSRYADPVTVWLTVAVLYLLLTIPLTQVAAYMEKRLVRGAH
ncbi:MAG: amino acid ABC transporter permease, partial [Candidatus Sericytochromatia bacterium]